MTQVIGDITHPTTAEIVSAGTEQFVGWSPQTREDIEQLIIRWTKKQTDGLYNIPEEIALATAIEVAEGWWQETGQDRIPIRTSIDGAAFEAGLPSVGEFLKARRARLNRFAFRYNEAEVQRLGALRYKRGVKPPSH